METNKKNSPDLQTWDQATKDESITIEDLNKAAEAYAEARKKYDETRKIHSEANIVMEEKKAFLLELMKKTNQDSFKVKGLGNFIKTNRYTIKVPKSLGDKVEMLKYLRNRGEDTYLSLVSVNSMTLNSWYKTEKENDPNFNLPGVGEPTHMENITWRKK